jgi:hypothetical protein
VPNILDEYLIELGATVDQAGMRRFQNALRDATSFVDHQSFKMAGSFFKAQTEIVGGFAAIGTAALGLVNKVAMADQEYRLFALHMYMSKDAARSLKIAMDALGAPLEDLTWDPELRGRTAKLLEDQRAMAPGGDFDAQMRKVRDIRFEFTRMEVELKYLAMHTVMAFLHNLGSGPDELLAKLQKFNDWVIKDMPGIASRMATEFTPIWHELLDVARETGVALKDAGVVFTNLVGLFTGDKSIQGTTFNLEKMLTAVQHVIKGFADFAVWMDHLEQSLSHFVLGLSLLADGKLKEAGAEFGAAYKGISTEDAVKLFGAVAGGAVGGPAGAAAGVALAQGVTNRAPGLLGLSPAMPTYNAASLRGIAKMAGIDPNLLMSLAMVESGMHQTDAQGHLLTSKAGALGLMQLMPGTAKQYGVDPSNVIANATGGAFYMRDLLKKYGGNIAKAVGAYNWGQGHMDSFLAGKATMPAETRNEIASVLGRMGQTGSVTIGSITIDIKQPNATPQQIASAVSKGVTDAKNKATQRNLAEFSDLGWAP